MNPLCHRVALCATFLSCAGGVSAQDDFVSVPRAVLDRAGRILPERPSTGAPFLSALYSPNFVVSERCSMRAVFLWELAGYRNAVGYFTWRATGDGGVEVVDSDLLFPDVSMDQRVLDTGMTSWLRDRNGNKRVFVPGERVGFFVVADGAQVEAVRGWTFSPGIPASDPTANQAIGRGTYTSLPELNPDGAQHVALVRVPPVASFLSGREHFLLGFEDLDRRSGADDDFNEGVFVLDVMPVSAVSQSRIFAYDETDRDRDGVAGLADMFPDDPLRAYATLVPQHGFNVLAFEDMYPISQDTDFDDAVFAFVFVVTTDAKNDVKDILADFHLVGRGASFDHSFGLHIPGLPSNSRGTVSMQLVPSAGAPSPIETRDLSEVVSAHRRRIHGVFPSTRAVLPPASPYTSFANTQLAYRDQIAASARVLIEFDRTVKAKKLGAVPFDPYLVSYSNRDGTVADVHLPGFSSFADVRSRDLPVESGSGSFVTDAGNPWALLVPSDWRFPLEGVPITRAYPAYELWRDSGGRSATDWYLHPTIEPEKVSKPIATYLRRPAWTLRAPVEPR